MSQCLRSLGHNSSADNFFSHCYERIGFPRWLVISVSLIAPRHPAFADAAGKEFEIGRGLHASMRPYCSSGLRECSRLRVASRFTCRRPGASVRAFLPRTPNRMSSVTLRK